MFKRILEQKLKNIFKIDKVSFAAPSDTNEQNILFVEIKTCPLKVTESVSTCRATGKLTLFSVSEKIPFGYFHKRIYNSYMDDVKDLFFYNIEENTNYAGAGNLVERSAEFVFFYKEQFDPAHGVITTLTLT